MKPIVTNKLYIFLNLILMALTAALQQGCKKVDNYFDEVGKTPQIYTREDPDRALRDVYTGAGYKPVYVVGDTATWQGLFYIDAGLPLVRIGNAEARIVYSGKFKPAIVSASELNEVIRFVITEDMGLGSNRPVQLQANGITINAPDITINKFVGLDSRTDTSLFVEKLATWQPENPQDYFLPLEERPNFNNGKLPWISNASTALDNTIYFNNNLGVFRVNTNESVDKLLTQGETLTENNQTFHIKYVINSVIDQQHTALYVSARTIDDNADTLNNHIFRLMKIDPATRSVTTLNRTLIPKDGAATGITPEPVQGAINAVPLIATRMTWTASGLYFVNQVLAAPITNANSYKIYLAALLNNAVNTSALNTLCRLQTSANTVQVLMRSNDYTNAGLKIGNALTHRVKPDGTMLYTLPADLPPLNVFGIQYYDVQLGQPIFTRVAPNSDVSMRFVSFDPDTATAYTKSRNINLGSFNLNTGNWIIAPSGDVISFFENATFQPPSLYAVNFDANKLYCYAGTEKGLFNTKRERPSCLAAPGQNQETGKAKYVEFCEMNCAGVSGSNTLLPRLISADVQGSVFFYKFSSITDQFFSSIRFFRMYPKK